MRMRDLNRSPLRRLEQEATSLGDAPNATAERSAQLLGTRRGGDPGPTRRMCGAVSKWRTCPCCSNITWPRRGCCAISPEPGAPGPDPRRAARAGGRRTALDRLVPARRRPARRADAVRLAGLLRSQSSPTGTSSTGTRANTSCTMAGPGIASGGAGTTATRGAAERGARAGLRSRSEAAPATPAAAPASHAHPARNRWTGLCGLGVGRATHRRSAGQCGRRRVSVSAPRPGAPR